MRRNVVTLFLAAICVFSAVSYAEEILDHNFQSVLITKILRYDNNIVRKDQDKDVVLAILCDDSKESLSASRSLLKAFLSLKASGTKIGTRNLDFKILYYQNKATLEKELIENAVQVVYVNMLDKEAIEVTSKVTKQFKLLTITGINPKKLVESGMVSVGLSVKNDSPVILVNKNSYESEGSDFAKEFLKIVVSVGE